MSYVDVPGNKVRRCSVDNLPGKGDDQWCAAEFQKRRGTFENVLSGEAEELALYDEDDTNPVKARRLRELMHSQNSPPEFGIAFGLPNNTSKNSSEKDLSVGSLKPPSSQSSSWLPMSHPSSEPTTGEVTNQSSHAPMNQHRFIDEDDDGLGVSSNRRPPPQNNSGQRENLAIINDNHGNIMNQQNILSSSFGGLSSLPYLHHHRDMDMKEDCGLSHQIEFLTAKNQQLQKQLGEREVERDRLREQLETQRMDKGFRSVCSPSGLPSRVLDGRRVLRESVSLVTVPMVSSTAPCSPHSPFPPPSPLHIISPLSPPNSPQTPLSPLTPSPLYRLPFQSDSESGSKALQRHGTSIDHYQLSRNKPVSSASSSAIVANHQVESLKRYNKELEKRLHELADEKRRLESDLKMRKESFIKMQAREQDLSKDIEILRDENSHHTSAIKRLQGERDGLKNENDSLHDELSSITDKLNKTETCYKEVEHENLSLEAEIEQLVHDKKQLFDEKQKLQTAVEGALKTKESYRSTIKQLRKNQSLEDPMRWPPSDGTRGGMGVINRPKKVVIPATREQKTLSDVMNLREEKLQLQEKLLSAQQEIDSLEVHLKIQDSKDVSEGTPVGVSSDGSAERDLKEEISIHFSHFHSHVTMVRADFDSARGDIAFFSSQQHALVRKNFLVLVGKCRELLLAAEDDKSSLAEALHIAESSLSKMEDDYNILKEENSILQTQRDEVLDDVACLKDEISKLKDHKRLQDVRLLQNETFSQDREQQINEMKSEKIEIEEQYHSLEKKWQEVVDELQREWDGKETELTQKCEFLSEEKDLLLAKKDELEVKLSLVMLDNDKLTIVRDGLECQLKQMEGRMQTITLEVDENECTISQACTGIAKLLAQKVCISAEMIVTQEDLERRLELLQEEKSLSTTKSEAESSLLKDDIETLESEKNNLVKRLEEISGKERNIGMLESKIASLKISKADMQSELEALTKKYASLAWEFHILEETEDSRRLNNEKLKMTLTTEIKLLRSKLSTVEMEKHELESALSKMDSNDQNGNGVSATKQIEQLKKQIVVLQSECLQQQMSGSQDISRGGKNAPQLNDLKSHVTVLETEKKILKEKTKKMSTMMHSLSSPSSMDESMLINLRKKVMEMTHKTFFLETDKHHLADKVKTLSANLKLVRDSKSRLSNEHVQKLQAENSNLQDQVLKLEENLTTKLMAADSKILETVSENDRLQKILLQVQSALSSIVEEHKDGSLQATLDLLKSESEILLELKSSLSASSSELQQMELSHQQIESLQQELQLTLSSQEPDSLPSRSTSSSSSGSRNVPSVFKSLPVGYLNFQYRKGSSLSPVSRTDSRSLSVSSSNPEIPKKMSEMTSATKAFGESLKRHKMAVREKEAELNVAHKQLVELAANFQAESGRSKCVSDILSGLHKLDFTGEKLNGMMKRQIESLQDQVMVRDSALSDIETQMKADFEAHHKKFTFVKSQVLELREQMSAMKDVLRSKDQYIYQTEERCIALENELFKVRKELEGTIKGQKSFLRENMSEKMKMQGVTSVTDVIQLQREEVHRLQNSMRDFTSDLTQVQSKLEASQREKRVLLTKCQELERMHMEVKEHMGEEIHYLRQLNLQMVEIPMKAEKATEILKEVREVQNVFKKQRELRKVELELDITKVKVLEKNNRISELESQLTSQAVAIKILQAEKEHSVVLTHPASPELSNQFSRMHMRPRSAESARKPNYKISDFKTRIGPSGRTIYSEFSIVLPSQNSRQGNIVLNLEEQPETNVSQHTLSLGPMVVTDDEYTMAQEVETTAIKQQRFQKLKRGHRRTASTGSSIVALTKDRDGGVGSKAMTGTSSEPVSKRMVEGRSSKTLPARGQLYAPLQMNIGIEDQDNNGGGVVVRRPGSAGSTTSQISHVHQESRPVVPTLHLFKEYADAGLNEGITREEKDMGKSSENGKEIIGAISTKMMDETSGSKMAMGGKGMAKLGVTNTAGGGKLKSRYDLGRIKTINKSSDSNEATSSDGNGFSSKSSSQSDSSAGSGHGNVHVPMMRTTLKRLDRRDAADSSTLRTNENVTGLSLFNPHGGKAGQNKNLSRAESTSSTCSTLSIYGNSTLPSRNHSFTYDGGEESCTYSHESLENLQALDKLGYNPYMNPIVPSETYTTSSSDEENYRKNNRRKKSANTGGDNTPRHRDLSYHGNNSSGESDTTAGDSYHDNGGDKSRQVDIPVHVNESISISDMDREATDIEMEQKATDLQQCFRRVCYSSTGSVKICYSQSSTEDISKH